MAQLLDPAGVPGCITAEQVDAFRDDFDREPRYRLAMNAVCNAGVEKIAMDRSVVSALDRSFSVHLPEFKATSQNSSGRCWMFAALNTMRPAAAKALNVGEEFELSQNYLAFWDKLEKANFFLESVLKTVDEPVGSRLLDHLLSAPVQDGGQWHMFVNLVRKYGVLPKAAMPETDSSGNTGRMNFHLTSRLREYACRLRDAYGSGASLDELRPRKEEMLGDIYRMLTIHLGEPPSRFDWQWRDKDKVFHRAGRITPQEFFERYVKADMEGPVCLIHDPRPGHRTMRLYTVKFLGNVVEGLPIAYVNVDLDIMKRAAVSQMSEGAPVWFGCDVGKYLDRDLGLMDLDLFDYESVYGSSESMNKAERLQYGHSCMTHAMVFTGVDLDEQGKPAKWRVENSWSDKPGDKGFFQMTDSWFDEYTYEVVVDRRHLSPEVLAVLEQSPVELEPWDPMGSLARA